MKTLEREHLALINRLNLKASKTLSNQDTMKIVVLKRVFFGFTLLGSMMVYLWVFLPQL